MSLPHAFIGTWTNEADDNLEPYLESQGVPWLLRKACTLSGHTIKYADLGNGRYSVEQSTLGRSIKHEFSIGDSVVTKGMEFVERKLTFTLEGSSFIETHVYDVKTKPKNPVDRQVYSVENGKLVQHLQNGNVSCKRYFKKKN